MPEMRMGLLPAAKADSGRFTAFASEMAYLGLDAGDVGEVLGHTTRAITEEIYVHVFNRDKREQRIREAMAEAMG